MVEGVTSLGTNNPGVIACLPIRFDGCPLGAATPREIVQNSVGRDTGRRAIVQKHVVGDFPSVRASARHRVAQHHIGPMHFALAVALPLVDQSGFVLFGGDLRPRWRAYIAGEAWLKLKHHFTPNLETILAKLATDIPPQFEPRRKPNVVAFEEETNERGYSPECYGNTCAFSEV